MCARRAWGLLSVSALVVVVTVALPLQLAVAADAADADRASGEGWYVEFFNNKTLSGFPTHTWTDPVIGFDWGFGAPASDLTSDRFSIRWTGSVEFPYRGTYQFCAMADDGVRILVDNVLVLDEWHSNSGIAYCGSQRILSGGTHELKVEYYEDGGTAHIYVWWEEVAPISPYVPVLSPASEPAVRASVSADAPAPFDGWYGEYFGNRSLGGKPDLAQVEPAIGFDWGPERSLFSARWRQAADFEMGYYRFCAMADDGVRIWVDDALVVDRWHDNNGIVYCGTRLLTKGVHRIHVEYYQNRGQAFIYSWWERDLPHRWAGDP